MTNHFHMTLNRMAFFTAFLAVVLILFWPQFISIAVSNIVLNGIIIGTGLFGIGLCFYEMFKLLPEYRWLSAYVNGDKNTPLPPILLRPVALMLHAQPKKISTNTLQGFLDMIMVRFEDSRESVRYITNTLIFLGLLGTFWGLIVTVGGFSELLTSLDFTNESVLSTMQSGLSRPLSGMATAFTSSLLGLASSLSVGFLGLQVQLAQNAIFRELEDYLSAHTSVSDETSINQILPQINLITRELSRTVVKPTK
ncbi:MAG: hypothetical protein ACLRFJ_02630 [Alphaproteobacteria bacterium]